MIDKLFISTILSSHLNHDVNPDNICVDSTICKPTGQVFVKINHHDNPFEISFTIIENGLYGNSKIKNGWYL